jgi:hypothetical protein
MGLYEKAKQKSRRFLLRRLPACRETVPLISQSMERPLSLRERIAVKLHLMICSWCQWYLEHLQTLRSTLRAQPPEPPEENFAATPGLSVEAKDRLKQRLSNLK